MTEQPEPTQGSPRGEGMDDEKRADERDGDGEVPEKGQQEQREPDSRDDRSAQDRRDDLPPPEDRLADWLSESRGWWVRIA